MAARPISPRAQARRTMRALSSETSARGTCDICGEPIVWSAAWDPPLPLDPGARTVVPDPAVREMVVGHTMHGARCTGTREQISAMRMRRAKETG